jgi:hypothetical protein
MSVYPNPASGRTMLRLRLPSPADVRVSLYDMQGRRLETLVDGAVHETERGIDLAGIAPGIYVLRMEIAGTGVVRTIPLTVVR